MKFIKVNNQIFNLNQLEKIEIVEFEECETVFFNFNDETKNVEFPPEQMKYFWGMLNFYLSCGNCGNLLDVDKIICDVKSR